MKVLTTGAAGYIGSHTVVELLNAGHDVSIVDNLSNSNVEVLRRIEEIAERKPAFHEVDVCDADALKRVFHQTQFDSVIHFAGLKAVGESVENPLTYYRNNVGGTVTLCQVMRDFGVKNLVFSSSATVYGDPTTVPISEDQPTGSTTNPYGRSKYIVEEVLRDLHVSDCTWNIALLRYFNPIGAHPSGRIGEDPAGIPNNLVPYIAQVAVGRRDHVQVFGDDYETHDGTGVRDYIHVVDLALGHLAALEKLNSSPGLVTYNLGTGKGYSVLDVLQAFAKASGKEIPHCIVERRPGDIAQCFADPGKAMTRWHGARHGESQRCVRTRGVGRWRIPMAISELLRHAG